MDLEEVAGERVWYHRVSQISSAMSLREWLCKRRLCWSIAGCGGEATRASSTGYAAGTALWIPFGDRGPQPGAILAISTVP
jgi:hypothetical protein